MKFASALLKPRLSALFLLALALCGATTRGYSSESAELTVFAAASLTDVMAELAVPFEAAHNVRIVYNFAGSNTLAHQLAASPKADVFFSASEKWMDFVQKAGVIDPDTRKSVLSNTLVVIANPASDFSLDAPEKLPDLGFKFLSLGDPDAVPAGRYAKAWLSGLDYGDGSVWDAVKDKVSPAPDVRAALAQVEGSDDVVGIVYQTDCVGAEGKVRKIFIVPAAGLGISYPAAVLKEAEHPELAREFLEYVTSPEAEAIFEKYGFGVLK